VRAKRIAIRDVTVIPMDRPRALPRHTIVIENGRIEQLGPVSHIPTAGMHVIEASGWFVMPGLADMHVHFNNDDDAEMMLAYGVTFVRNMMGSAEHLDRRDRIATASLLAPWMMTTTPVIDAPREDAWEGTAFIRDPLEAADMVKRFAADGYEQTKVYSGLDGETLGALGKASAEHGLPMVGHCPNALTFEQAIDAGVSCFEHLLAISNGRLNRPFPQGIEYGARVDHIVEHFDWDSLRTLGDDMAARGVWNCPTMIWSEGLVREDRLERMSEHIRHVDPELLAWWNGRGYWGQWEIGNTPAAVLDAMRRLNEHRIRVLGVLGEHGAPLLIGTDMGNPYTFPGLSVHEEIELWFNAGFSTFETFRAATTSAARYLGDSGWGTVEEGKRADLLLLREDPITHPRAARSPEMVFANGVPLTRAELDAMLERRATRFAG
jgi:imidazolonepropionase-like amidohydrolase